MRQSQHNLKTSEVQHLYEQLLTPLLGTWPPVRKCTLGVVVAILGYAASRITSISDACSRLLSAPDGDTVLEHLNSHLGSADQLDRRLRRCLIASLPRALRRGRFDVAIDTTLIPYHGKHLEDLNEIFRGQAKSGTTHFHAYATAYVVKDGMRFTVAVMWVRHGTTPVQIVRELRRRVVAAGVSPKLFLLDRGFSNGPVVRYLQHARQKFIMPQAVHGKKPKDGKLTGLRLIRAEHASGWTRYSWKPSGSKTRVSVDICVYRRRRTDRHGNRAFLYACWGVSSDPLQVYRKYRLRFGIETSYRQMNQARIRTTTRNPVIRLLFVAVALLLRNLWVWLHWTRLAASRRGRRRVRLGLLALRTMIDWLRQLAEERFGRQDSTWADHPPTEPLTSPRPVLS